MNCDGARHDWHTPAHYPATIKMLRKSLDDARTMERQYQSNEDHYMKLALDARARREGYAIKAAELGQAIAQLGGIVEEVAA